MENPFKYAGEIFDEETGLYYLRARYYDPVAGRFISEDMYAGNITYPLTLNLYTYVTNNPLKYWDPSGYAMAGDDKLGLSKEHQQDIDQLGEMWERANKEGNKAVMQAAHNAANDIRLKYTDAVIRIDFETGEITTKHQEMNQAVQDQGGARIPDFITLSGSITIPTPWTGTLISKTFSGTLDRSGVEQLKAQNSVF